jgi:hypothetical protein
MLIARADIKKLGIKVPRNVMSMSRTKNVETLHVHALYGADTWIGCLHCWPHTDSPGFSNEYFLTLSVHGEEHHMVGDDQMPPEEEGVLTPGDIFIVDPCRKHWLAPVRCDAPNRPWVGLQWDIPRDEAPARVREILKRLDAHWLTDADPRYASWKGVEGTGSDDAQVR